MAANDGTKAPLPTCPVAVGKDGEAPSLFLSRIFWGPTPTARA
jgi:hypothetical protein